MTLQHINNGGPAFPVETASTVNEVDRMGSLCCKAAAAQEPPAAPADAQRLTDLLERLREKCAEAAEQLQGSPERTAAYIRSIELDVAVRSFLAASPAAAPPEPTDTERDAARLDHGLNKGVAMWLKNFLKPGEKVIWREPFRWKDEDGVLSNHYEMFDLPQLAEDFGYEIVEDFHHAAIVRAALKGQQ